MEGVPCLVYPAVLYHPCTTLGTPLLHHRHRCTRTDTRCTPRTPLTRTVAEVTVTDRIVTAGKTEEREDGFFKAEHTKGKPDGQKDTSGTPAGLETPQDINRTFATFINFARFLLKTRPDPLSSGVIPSPGLTRESN